jgi:hypothetical protein
MDISTQGRFGAGLCESAESGAEMAILLLKILAVWSSLATVAAFALGAAIQRGERARWDVYLTCVYAAIEVLQASQH